MSSECLPEPTTLPCSSTMILSASSIVPTLCATMILVAPAVSSDRALLRSRSVLESNAENVSSNRYIGGSLRTARAMDSLCFCPPERFQPCCDTSESRPSGIL